MSVRLRTLAGVAVGLVGAPWAAAQHVMVFPTLPHAASNTIPLGFSSGNTGITVHQVFASSLFSAVTSGQPAEITRMALAPTGAGTFSGHLVVRLGYTDRVPGQLPTVGLDLPDLQGGGTPNAVGTMHEFYNAQTVFAVVSPGPENFQFVLDGTPFIYNPAQGNLLMEIVVTDQISGISVSRSAGSAEASRAYRRISGSTSLTTTQAHRTQFTFTTAGTPPCYANCDGSTVEPILNVSDFICFQTEYAAGSSYANCDGSTVPPVLNVSDFICFQSLYAAGCT